MKNTMRIMIDDLSVDVDEHLVFRGDEQISLTAKEYQVLKYLALNKDSVVSRAELLKNVWDLNYDCFSNVVDVYIRFLRAKIDDGHHKKLIKTVRSKGYLLTS
ncbi:MAG: winged helix-turn-helix domain-containing protein [Christensenellaceae bacterium]